MLFQNGTHQVLRGRVPSTNCCYGRPLCRPSFGYYPARCDKTCKHSQMQCGFKGGHNYVLFRLQTLALKSLDSGWAIHSNGILDSWRRRKAILNFVESPPNSARSFSLPRRQDGRAPSAPKHMIMPWRHIEVQPAGREIVAIALVMRVARQISQIPLTVL